MNALENRIAALILGMVVFASILPPRPTEAEAPTPLSPTLPKPTGPHLLGTTTVYFPGTSRTNLSTTDSMDHRPLTVQVWYPAAARGQKPMPYIPNKALLPAMKKEHYLNLSPDVLESWRNMQTHSTRDAPIISSPQRLPLLLFSHGFSMSRSNYTCIVEELASHGYIVAAIDHPYAGLTVLPDGRVLSFNANVEGDNPAAAAQRVEAMAQDALFVLDALLDGKHVPGRFAARINPARVGMLGHSIGGAAALESCRSGNRFKACADLDGDAWGKAEEEGVGQPFLVLLNEPAESYRPPMAIREQRDRQWVDLISKRETKAFVVKIENTNHFSFSDIPFVVPDALMKKNGAFLAPHRGWEVITRILLAFFFQYLNGEQGEPLEEALKGFPEVSFRTFAP